VTSTVLLDIVTDVPLNAPVIEQAMADPAVAIGNGYSESKWVAERILVTASAAVPMLKTTSVRIGQLSGALNGAWNPNEWLPAIIRSGPVLRCLPQLKGVRLRVLLPRT
jgi:thioester reductase-like protein